MIINELRPKYNLNLLLTISEVKKSTYHYHQNKVDKDNKNDSLMNQIISLFYQHKSRYGYRRVTLELANRGIIVNHKKVQRLMNKMGLAGIKRNRRKYSSYKGTVGKIADNLIERNFHASEPTRKWYTDVSEFNLRGSKVYLSPIIDGFNGEIVSYEASLNADTTQLKAMMKKAFKPKRSYEGLILHSDQGWQYQMNIYQQMLEDLNIKQSMSRKGNSMDNGMIEGFFSTIKSEMFYNQEYKYNNTDELIAAIKDYIHYYNHDRIRTKLKGLSPVQYRIQSFQ